MQKSSREDLADFIRRIINEKKLKLREVEEVSSRKGNKITHGYLSKILSRKSGNPSVEKLHAIAIGLGVHSKEVFAAAGVEYTEAERDYENSRFQLLYLKFDGLPPESKVEAEKLMGILERELERLGKQK